MVHSKWCEVVFSRQKKLPLQLFAQLVNSELTWHAPAENYCGVGCITEFKLIKNKDLIIKIKGVIAPSGE